MIACSIIFFTFSTPTCVFVSLVICRKMFIWGKNKYHDFFGKSLYPKSTLIILNPLYLNLWLRKSVWSDSLVSCYTDKITLYIYSKNNSINFLFLCYLVLLLQKSFIFKEIVLRSTWTTFMIGKGGEGAPVSWHIYHENLSNHKINWSGLYRK